MRAARKFTCVHLDELGLTEELETALTDLFGEDYKLTAINRNDIADVLEDVGGSISTIELKEVAKFMVENKIDFLLIEKG